MQENIWAYPSSIEIDAKQGASLVTINNSIYIKHWYNSKYEVLS